VQIDFRLSFKFDEKTGGVSVAYAPLVPEQFEKGQKKLMVWQDAYMHATLGAIDEFLHKNGHIGKREVKRFMKTRNKNIKAQKKARKAG